MIIKNRLCNASTKQHFYKKPHPINDWNKISGQKKFYRQKKIANTHHKIAFLRIQNMDFIIVCNKYTKTK